MSNDSRVTPETQTKPELVPHDHPQRERSERVRRTDIAAISSEEKAKQLATNQGVHGFVMQSIGKSELAISQAMTEVFQQFNTRMGEMTQQMDALRDAFEKVSRIQQSQLVQAFGRIRPLEERWWERLMRDLEWDWYTIMDWCVGFFGWTAESIEVEVDPDVVDITPYLQPAVTVTEEDDGGAPSLTEWTVCCCGHTADQHNFTEPSPCGVDGCGCADFIAVGTTADPALVRQD